MQRTIEEYDLAMDMFTNNYLGKEISNQLNIPKSTLSLWKNNKRMPILKRLILEERQLLNNQDFSYIKGAIIGDGNISFNKNRQHSAEVCLKVKDKGFAFLFAEILKRWSGKRISVKYYKNRWNVRCYSWSVAQFVLKNQASNFIEFLKGFVDAEGSIDIQKGYARIQITNQDLELLRKIQFFLKENNVISSINKRQSGFSKKDCYNLAIKNKEGIFWFYKNIGFRIQRKQVKLEKWIEKTFGKMENGGVKNGKKNTKNEKI